ncbi:MAG: hypothetical protein RML36_05900 [Anaerolineae bacterium]|nr:glycosyltransferase family 39 protein [Anaerolineae bacterium]MDW8099002.1 hypothetical protein [Anaerolineae bacterium]
MRLSTLKDQARSAARSPGLLVIALTALTLLLRTWELGRIPPWLWFDEAGNGLDARELLYGQFRLFFPRSLGKEPFYNYLITPFVAAWDGTVLAIRLPAALLGTLMVPTLYIAGRAFWRDSRCQGSVAGLAAASFWAVNYWPQSVNRIGLRVNTLPLVLTLAIVAWLLWTRWPSRRRAIFFGALAALTLYTYLAARATLLLWPLLWWTLPARQRQAVRPTVGWAVLAFGLTLAPLAGHFVANPQDAFQRTGSVITLVSARSVSQQARLLTESLGQVVGGFLGLAGDPLPRHNLPGRPPFAWLLAMLFALGGVLLLRGLRRREQRSWTLLLWWGVMILPATLAAENNPHFLRLFGALPAALLIAATPLAWVADRIVAFRSRLSPGKYRVTIGMLLLLLIGFWISDGTSAMHTYFVTWGRKTDLYSWYQGDIWSYGEQVSRRPDTIGLTSASPHFYILEYAFKQVQFLQVSVAEDEIEAQLTRLAPMLSGRRVAVPAWRDGVLVDTDPKEVLPFYLAREGELLERTPLKGFDLLWFQLGDQLQFAAPGRQATPVVEFGNGFKLLEFRWGTAYPNPARDSDIAEAGTAIWAVLTWQGAPIGSHKMPDLKAALDLVDLSGRRLVSDERPLLNAKHWPVSRWKTDDVARSYHLVTIPVTQLPGPIRLQARLYEAASLMPVRTRGLDARIAVDLATIEVLPNRRAVAVDTLPLVRRLDLPVAPGVTLLGLAPWPETTAPGQTLTLRAYWQITAEAGAQALTLTLGQDVAHTVFELPTGLPAGSIVHTDLNLRLPSDATSGVHLLRLGDIPIGDVMVVGRPRRFSVPAVWVPLSASFGDVVTLLGVDAPLEMRAGPDTLRATAGQPLKLTFIWQAHHPDDRELTRFVHLLGSDGRPIAQEDSVPCQGTCAASSWLSAEILSDEAILQVPQGLPTGRYRLAVGWYDAASLVRLPAQDQRGSPLPDDLLILPLAVKVTP